MTEPLPDARSVLIAEQEKEIERLRALLSRTGTSDAKTGEAVTECRDQGVKCPERECLQRVTFRDTKT